MCVMGAWVRLNLHQFVHPVRDVLPGVPGRGLEDDLPHPGGDQWRCGRAAVTWAEVLHGRSTGNEEELQQDMESSEIEIEKSQRADLKWHLHHGAPNADREQRQGRSVCRLVDRVQL